MKSLSDPLLAPEAFEEIESHVCGEDDEICEECCEHGDTDEYCCLDCGKELTEERMAAAYDRAKAARQDG